MKHFILLSILCVPFFAFAQKVQIEKEASELKKSNVFTVLINANDKLLVQGEAMEVSEIREKTKRFVMNPSHDKNMAESPEKAVIILKKSNDACSEFYSTVLNELKAAYESIWNQIAIERYGLEIKHLNEAVHKEIYRDYPMVIREK
jgi:biopolymer transport protein ExbD